MGNRFYDGQPGPEIRRSLNELDDLFADAVDGVGDISAHVAAAAASADTASSAAGTATTKASEASLSAEAAATAKSGAEAIYGDVTALQTAVSQGATSAEAAATQAGISTTQAGLATAAKTAAELARDVALIQAGVYATEALGRAAVADGQAFKVQGSGDVAAYEYRRTNSTTSVLIATYPSKASVDALVTAITSGVEGDENLYTAANSLIDRYISGSWSIGASSAAQAWRVAVVPVTEGQTYSVYFGPSFPDGYWQYGMYATGPLQANGLGTAAKIVYGATLDTQVKTFTVPAGQGITHAFINAKVSVEDYTTTMIVQSGSAVPVRPLAYVPALKKVDGKPVKDMKARTKIAALERLTYGDTRFVGQKFYYFGDSITEGTYGGYVKYITDILQCVPTNYGSSGARTGRLVALATDQLNRQEVGGAATNPDYTGVVAVTIQIGTNDISSPGTIGTIADIPTQSIIDLPFTPSGGSLTSTPAQYWALFPNTFYGNLGLVIEYIKYRNSKTLVYLISPPHQNGADMAVIRTALQAIAKFYSVRFIDAQDEAGLEKKQLLKYSYDGTHLNTLGNELWGRYVGHRISNS